MSSAVKVILGVSVLAMSAGFAACDNGSSDGGTPPITVAGSGNGAAGAGSGVAGAQTGGAGAPATAGTTGSAGAGTAGGAPLPEGIPLTPSAGWVPVDNAAMIQGAVFSFADPYSKVGLMDNLMDATDTRGACISGTAAKVDTASDVCVNKTFTPPATDCYGEYWGAAIGMNLNQAIDMTLTPPAGGTPAPYDASALKGFAFEVQGDTVPAPGSFRFKVEDGTKEYCNPSSLKIKVGVNTVLFSDLVAECWSPPSPPSKADDPAVQSKLIKISWQVVTNTSAAVPFNFCISNIRALPK